MHRPSIKQRLNVVSLAVSLGMFLTGVSLAPDAAAVIDEADPNDVSSTFDVRRAQSIPDGKYLRFTVRFYEELDWRRNTVLQIYFDSRSGPGFDYLLHVSQENGKIRSTLTPRGDPADTTRLFKLVWPRRIYTYVIRRMLRPTHVIQWKVRTLTPDPGDPLWEIDRAPDKFSDWFPHV